jgi:rare lipoprotein A
MVVRLGVATCVAVIMFAYPTFSITQSAGHKHIEGDVAVVVPGIIGIASTYNPYRPDHQSGGTETASGEPYDPTAWTAAIQTDLREKFGGVRYGKDYRATYALVASANKQAVIKINDVGQLEAGRVIDLNEQTMRYFDPTLELGLIYPVTVIPLLGDDWSPGPIGGDS